MRVLFLDFDGVLNTMDFLRKVYSGRRADPEVAAYQDRPSSEIDPEKVALLNQIVRATYCTVVVSSSWRYDYNRHELYSILLTNKFEGTVFSTTPESKPGEPRPRGLEIQEWLDRYAGQVKTFVIVDDNDDMEHLKHRLVLTDVHTGLTQEHVDRIIQMLKEST